jgi:Flp pilus assembly protein TadD
VSFLRRKRLVRKLVVAAVVLAGALAWIVVARRGERYVPGTGAEGLFDSLGRKLPDDRPAVRFVDVAEQAGLRFRHFPSTRTNRLPEDMGSGVALGDVDGDGWTDVFLVNMCCTFANASSPPSDAGRCALFRNRGDGSFEDISRASGADLAVLGNAAAFLDLDSDGDLDLLVTSFGALHLLRNDGHAHFEDVTRAAGLADLAGFWTGIAVGDYDRDGAIDAYVCGYVRYVEEAGSSARTESQYGVDIPINLNPSSFEPERNLLLHNRGDGTFEEVARELGVDNTTGRSLGATFADLSGDGWPDLYVANDVSDNAYFQNRGDGTFEDRTNAAQIGDYRGAMGLAVADFDGDFDFDFVVTHWLAQENALYVNMSRAPGSSAPPIAPTFMDMADRFGFGAPTLDKVGWATRFFDFDDDGRLDLFVVNGSTVPRSDDATALTPQRSQLFWNAGDKRGFFELGALAGEFFGEEHVGRGGATFDYDLDGDEDLVVAVHGDRARLLRNDGGHAHHSLRVRLRQPRGNRFAIGALVQIRAGELAQVEQLDTQGSYLSQHAVGEIAFGLGAAVQVDELRVTWPDGTSASTGPIAADCLVTWTSGEAPAIELLPGARKEALAGPKAADEQRRFYALLEQTSKQRVAGDCAAAIDGYRRALDLWPTHEDCLYNLGNCLSDLGRRDEALATFAKLVTYHPQSSRGWMQIGNLLIAGGAAGDDDLAQAERAFERSRAINGEESQPVVRLGIVAMLRGDLARADELLASATLLNSQSVEARWFRARVAWLRDDRERARTLLGDAHELALSKPKAAPAVKSEGDTKTGSALLAARTQAPQSLLERWKSVGERPVDPQAEFGAPPR